MDNLMSELYYIGDVPYDYERYRCDPEYRQELKVRYEIDPEFRKAVDNEALVAQIITRNSSISPIGWYQTKHNGGDY